MADAYAPYQQQQSSAYRHPDPKISGQRDENGPPPARHAAQHHATGNAPYDPSYFPPPPRSERGYDEAGGRQTASYAGSEAREDDGQAMTPYDGEKAYAQYSDAYGPPDYGGQRPAPPPSDYDRRQEQRGGYDDRRHDDRRHEDRRHDDRRQDDSGRYEDRERRRNSRPPPSDYDYEYDDDYDRRRDSRPPASHADDRRHRDKRSPDKRSPIERGKDLLRGGGGEGERGLGATLLGGAAGAFIGDQVGGKGKHGKDSALGTLGGALVGAIGAHAAERQWDKREKSKEERERGKGGTEERNKVARRSYMDEYAAGGDDPYYGSRGQSREDGSRGGAAPRDEFRPRRADQRSAPPKQRRRRREESSDSYTSDE
ncbi:hypothetical protein LTR85_004862 [Meristemomyces frigidus]|nr:hypothetical protein LTR85_004862 [Meristemomyces frigidus]